MFSFPFSTFSTTEADTRKMSYEGNLRVGSWLIPKLSQKQSFEVRMIVTLGWYVINYFHYDIHFCWASLYQRDCSLPSHLCSLHYTLANFLLCLTNTVELVETYKCTMKVTSQTGVDLMKNRWTVDAAWGKKSYFPSIDNLLKRMGTSSVHLKIIATRK